MAVSPWQSNPYLSAATSAAPAATADAENPFSVISNIKNPEIDARLKKLLELFDQSSTSGAGAIADYKTSLDKATPALEGQNASDIANLTALSDGTAAGELAKIRAAHKKAVAGLTARSMGDLARVLGTTQLTLGGGGRSLGTGSFLTKLGLDKASQLNVDAELQDANAQHGDFMDLLTKRLAATGQRQGLTDALAGRSLLPYQAETSRLGALTSAISGLSREDLLNRFIGLKAAPGAFST